MLTKNNSQILLKKLLPIAVVNLLIFAFLIVASNIRIKSVEDVPAKFFLPPQTLKTATLNAQYYYQPVSPLSFQYLFIDLEEGLAKKLAIYDPLIFAYRRVSELEKYGNDIPVVDEYISWKSMLENYQENMEKALEKAERTKKNNYYNDLYTYLLFHENTVDIAIYRHLPPYQKKAVQDLKNKVFSNLLNKIRHMSREPQRGLNRYSLSDIAYNDNYLYEVLVDPAEGMNDATGKLKLIAGSNTYLPENKDGGALIKYRNVRLSDDVEELYLELPVHKFSPDNQWTVTEDADQRLFIHNLNLPQFTKFQDYRLSLDHQLSNIAIAQIRQIVNNNNAYLLADTYLFPHSSRKNVLIEFRPADKPNSSYSLVLISPMAIPKEELSRLEIKYLPIYDKSILIMSQNSPGSLKKTVITSLPYTGYVFYVFIFGLSTSVIYLSFLFIPRFWFRIYLLLNKTAIKVRVMSAVLTACGFTLNFLILTNSSDLYIGLTIVLLLTTVWGFGLNIKYSVGAVLIMLGACSLFLIVKSDYWAEKSAVWAYIFLILAFLHTLASQIRNCLTIKHNL
jgi:hypothetical protein